MSKATNEAPLFTSLVEALRTRAAERPARMAYTFLADGEQEAGSLTFAQLDARARSIGAYLQDIAARGERVLLLCPAGLDYISAFYGCLYAGALAVPAYPLKFNRNLDRLLAIIEDSRPLVALTVSSAFERIRKQFDQVPSLSSLRWVCVDEIGDEGNRWRDEGVGRETLAFLQYTSGSTSSARGVMVSHGNLVHNETMMREAFGHDEETVMASWLPLYHDMGLIGIVLASVYNGVPCYFMSPADFLKKPLHWLRAMSRYRATFTGAPNFAYDLCVQKTDERQREGLDLSAWKIAGNGSEPVRAETLKRFAQAFEPYGFRPEALYPCYGLAEATLFVSGGCRTSPPVSSSFNKTRLAKHRAVPCAGSEADAQTLVSCGRAWLDELVVVSPSTLKRCAEGRVGEILISGGTVAAGYWSRPEETLETFRVRLAGTNEGSYLRTGDLGFFHRGELYVTGRRKDLIILRGRNLYPQDLELTAEESHPALASGCTAAFSVEHEGAERLVIVAELTRAGRNNLNVEEVAERLRMALGAEHDVELFSLALIPPGTLPKTSSGKIRRGACCKAFVAGTLPTLHVWSLQNPVAPSSDDNGFNHPPRTAEGVEHWLLTRLAALLKTEANSIDVRKPVAAYVVDSLQALELSLHIEETFGIKFHADSLFNESPTVAQLAARLYEQAQQTPPVTVSISNALGAKAPVANVALDINAKPSVETCAPKVEWPTVVHARRAGRAWQGNGNGNGGGHKAVDGEHPFPRYVNPYLGRLLSQLKMDKTFVRGEGCYLYDREGRAYLDFLAQYGALPFGFNHPRIWRAVEQMHERLEPSFVQPSYLDAAGELAERLIALAPKGLRHVTFANSGAEAVEAAIKLCKSSTRRSCVLAAHNGFHGKTLAALSATDRKKYQEHFGAPVEGYHYVRFGDLDALERELAGRSYAAFIVEPIQGEGGIIETPPGYLAQALRLCKATGTLLILDEIQTGLGRTGDMFACEAEGVTPDVLTLAKALGGGLVPVGACLCTEEVYNEDFALRHTSTFSGNALACRVGLATLELLEEDDRALLRQVANNGERLRRELLELQRKYPALVGEVRGRGYMLGIRFGIDRHTWGTGLIGYLGETEALAALVASHLLNHEGVRLGCTLNDGGVLRIEPPLIATWAECEVFLAALERTLDKLGTRNTAYFTAHLTGFEPNGTPAVTFPSTATTRLPVAERDGRFAFILHPLTERSYVDADQSLGVLSESQIRTLSHCMADNFDPFVVGDARIVSDTGQSAYGEFIIVPRTAEELVRLPREQTLAEIEAAVRVARDRGAKIIGLGAFTSVVSGGGLSLLNKSLPALTTGNTLTAVTGRQAIETALGLLGRELSESCVAVVGASGSIGRVLSLLLAPRVRRLIMLGNPEHPASSTHRLTEVTAQILRRLRQLCSRGEAFTQGTLGQRLCTQSRHLRELDADEEYLKAAAQLVKHSGDLVVSCDGRRWLPEADVVVIVTSTTSEVIRSADLKTGAVVCDISRPAAVPPSLRESRPDLFLIDGGVVSLPGQSTLRLRTDLDAGLVYACMAETMILALEQQYQDTGLGSDLSVAQALEFEQQAARHGFKLSLSRRSSASQPPDHNGG